MENDRVFDPGDAGPVQMPITGELDLHTFRPKEIRDLVPTYLAECRDRGILEVRVVHGKGIGNLRWSVHAILSRMLEVQSFCLAGEAYGGWGATVVVLRPQTDGPVSKAGELKT